MDDLTRLARPAVEQLLQASESQLLEQLGIRSRAIERDPAVAGSFAPAVVYDGAQMGLKDEVLQLGKRIFRRWNAEAYSLVCGGGDAEADDRRSLLREAGADPALAAAALAGVLVANAGLAPALAAVVAAIAIRRFFRPVYEEFCQSWAQSVERPADAADRAEP